MSLASDMSALSSAAAKTAAKNAAAQKAASNAPVAPLPGIGASAEEYLDYFKKGGNGAQWVKRLNSAFDRFKSEISSGNMTVSEYMQMADQLMPQINRDIYKNQRINSTHNTEMANAGLGKFIDTYHADPSNKNKPISVPFSKIEYAKLPDNVLPTREDVSKGLFDPVSVPFERYRETPTQQPGQQPGQTPTDANMPGPGQQPGETIVPADPYEFQQPTNQPIQPPQVDPATGQPIQPQVDPVTGQPVQNTDQYGIALPQTTIPGQQPVPGQQAIAPQQPTYDQGMIEALIGRFKATQQNAYNESLRQRQQGLSDIGQIVSGESGKLRGALDEALSRRKQGMTDLTGYLQQQEAQSFNQITPEIQEQMNAQGLLHSSALGQALAKERSNLAGQTATRLGAYGIETNELESQGIQDIARNQQDLQNKLLEQYYGNVQFGAQAPLDIAQSSTNLAQAGLERRFSLADWEREAKLAQSLGAQNTPQIDNGSGNQWAGAAGTLAGGTIGGLLGGPMGAGVGASIGGSAGSAAGSCHLVSYLHKLQLITGRQARAVHLKMAKSFEKYKSLFMLYYQVTPVFIDKANESGFDWKNFKVELVDRILHEDDSDKAFDHYVHTCKETFHGVLPWTNLDHLNLKEV